MFGFCINFMKCDQQHLLLTDKNNLTKEKFGTGEKQIQNGNIILLNIYLLNQN